jgi:hypothetical protein
MLANVPTFSAVCSLLSTLFRMGCGKSLAFEKLLADQKAIGFADAVCARGLRTGHRW